MEDGREMKGHNREFSVGCEEMFCHVAIISPCSLALISPCGFDLFM